MKIKHIYIKRKKGLQNYSLNILLNVARVSMLSVTLQWGCITNKEMKTWHNYHKYRQEYVAARPVQLYEKIKIHHTVSYSHYRSSLNSGTIGRITFLVNENLFKPSSKWNFVTNPRLVNLTSTTNNSLSDGDIIE